MDKIEMVGNDGRVHLIDPEEADLYYDGLTGEPISDAEWDEQKARLEQDNIGLVPEEFR